MEACWEGPSTAHAPWTGFEVENNTLGVGATDISQYNGGNTFAVWTNTIRTNPASPAPLKSSGDWLDAFSVMTTIDFFPWTDLTVLNYNVNSGPLDVELGTPVADFPIGFDTDLLDASDKNWVLEADPTWNNFTANQPVGAAGLWIGVNSKGLFSLIPVLSGIESAPLAYTAGGAAASVTSALTASDADSTTLAGATVQISGNYQSGQDVLSFTNTATITGTWNAITGTLTLSGTDTLANYMAALQSVKYVDTSTSPSTATRMVTFQVTDGSTTSNVVDRQITVSGTSNAASITLGAVAALSNNATPTFAGTATGNSGTVTVNIYSGSNTSGTLVETLTATPNATSGAYSVSASPALAAGTYTAQASQTDPADSSATTTFTVDTVAPTHVGPDGDPQPDQHGACHCRHDQRRAPTSWPPTTSSTRPGPTARAPR